MTGTRDGLLNGCDAESAALKRCVFASREEERTADNWLRLERDLNDRLFDVYYTSGVYHGEDFLLSLESEFSQLNHLPEP